MSDGNGRPPQARHARTGPVDRRRVLRISLLLGALIPGTAGLTNWLIQRGSAAPPARLQVTPRPARPSAAPPAASPSAPPSASTAGPLAGTVVVIDPGHNPNNPGQVAQIDKLVSAGGFLKACDTVGTETDAGYPEFLFTLDVARRARVILRAAGVKVILTQNGRTAYGPCVNQRAGIGNRARADAVVAIHADGGPPDGYGFAVLIPELVHNSAADNSQIIRPSRRLAQVMVRHFGQTAGQPVSTYLGAGGLQPRSDLAGLNLSTVPKVFIKCANMRNARDAAKVTDPRWRDAAAHGIARSLTHSSPRNDARHSYAGSRGDAGLPPGRSGQRA